MKLKRSAVTAAEAERHVVLRNLVVLRHVRVEVAFPVELTETGNATVTHEPGHDRLPDGFPVHDR